MKTTFRSFHAGGLCAALLVFASCLAHGQGAAVSGSPAPVLPAEFQKLQDQLDGQARRIDRLYRALGPHLEEMEERATEFEEQQAEDKALALHKIFEVQDAALGGMGCANPAAAEFGMLTTDGGVRIFDASGKPVKEFRQPGQDLTCVAFSPNGRELLAGTATGNLLVWELASQQCSTLRTNTGPKVDRVTWLGQDRIAWGAMRTYWAEGGKPVNHDKPAGGVLARNSGQEIWTFRSFVRDDFYTLAGGMNGQHLAVMEIPGEPRGAFLLDGATGRVLHTCYDEEHACGPLSVGLSPDGSTLAVGYAPYDIILWNARTGARQKLLKGHRNWVVSLAFSTDGKRLISGAGDSTARVWDVESGKEIGRMRFAGESTYVEGVGFSPKGDLVFATVRGVMVAAQAPSLTMKD